MVNEACVSKTRVAYVRPRDWLNNKVKAAITIPCIALKHRPLIPIITVWLPAINTRYRCLLANAPNNLQPNYNALSTRQFRFQCSRATFSDQMPVSLPNKRVPVTPPPLPPPPPLPLWTDRQPPLNADHPSVVLNSSQDYKLIP